MKDAQPPEFPESDRRILRRVVLHGAKRIGLFRVSLALTGGGLRILCYHGLSLRGESRFHPKLFMEPTTFAKRLQWLRDGGYPVLPLAAALEALYDGTLPRKATVITFDDGFYGVYQEGIPLLRRFGYPATIYVTSYYVWKEAPVFELTVRYMFWLTREATVEVDGLGLRLDGEGLRPIATAGERETVIREVLRYGEEECDHSGRVELLRALALRLGVSYEAIGAGRCMSLMNPREVRELGRFGIDVQLHTHRHRFPEDQDLAAREIADNRAALSVLVGAPLRHFCYPDGFWSRRHWPSLAAGGIESATTCERGLNRSSTPPFALRRFLDGEHISDIEFEAELSGFTELLRLGRGTLRKLFARGGTKAAREGSGGVGR